MEADEQVSPAEPKLLPFHAPPELLHLCAMDSLMPSPSRSMELGYESPICSLAVEDFTGTLVIKEARKEIHQTTLGDPLKASSIKILEATINSPTRTQSKQVDFGNPVSAGIEPKKTFASMVKTWAPICLDLGASVSPMKFSQTALQDTPKHSISELSSAIQWSSLAASNSKRTRWPHVAPPIVHHTRSDACEQPKSVVCPVTQVVREEDDSRFPWAAKMDPSVCNLYRSTTPIYMDDGTPKVQIPSHVFLQGLENQKEFVIGQFYRCNAPSGGLIHSVLNMIWGRNCKIFVRSLSETSFLFYIPDEYTRKWVTQRGLWHVDDCLMFVAAWSPIPSLDFPEINTVPVWVSLKNIPNKLYSIPGISWIASGLGALMLTNKPRLDPFSMGIAKIMVEVELKKNFPQRIAVEDEKGNISLVRVEYSWIPSKCMRCGHLGHKEARCLQPHNIDPKLEASEHGITRSLISASATVSHTKDAPLQVSSPIKTNSDISASSAEATVVSTSPTKNVIVSVSPTEVAANVNISTIEAGSVPAIITVADTEVFTLVDSEINTHADREISTHVVTESSPNYDFVSSTLDVSTVFGSTYEVLLPSNEIIEVIMIAPSSAEDTHMIEVEAVTSASSGNFVLPLSLDFGTPILESGNDYVCRTMENDGMVVGANKFAMLEQGNLVINSEQDVKSPTSHMTLRDKPVKPPQKVHDEWITISGPGRRGRRGRRGRENFY